MSTVPPAFFAELEARVHAVDSLLCVGLDPHASELGASPSAAAAEAFCTRLIDATIGSAAAYKPNAAFFEVYGDDGAAALRRVRAVRACVRACIACVHVHECVWG